MMEPLVSIVIPTWNGAHHLRPCLTALDGQDYRHFEIIVVDNGSTDETLDLLAREWPAVRVIAFPTNRGVVAAFNAGVKAARGALIALVNNDTYAEPAWLGRLVAGLLEHPEAGMAASKIRLWDESGRLHAVGDFYTLSGRPGNRGVWEADDGRWDEPAWVFSPNGAAALYRRELFDRVGLFDQGLGSYCEDVDLGWRAQLAGFRCRYVPDAVIRHRLSATGGGPIASYYSGRNWLYLIAKNYPTSLLAHHWQAIVREQLAVAWDALRAWRGVAARARLRGQLAGLLSLPQALAARGQIERAPEVTDDYLRRLLSAN